MEEDGNETMSDIMEIRRLARSTGLDRNSHSSVSSDEDSPEESPRRKKKQGKEKKPASSSDEESPGEKKKKRQGKKKKPASSSDEESPGEKRKQRRKSKKPASPVHPESDNSEDNSQRPKRQKKSKREKSSTPAPKKKTEDYMIPRKTSLLVPKNLWPSGMTASDVDKHDFDRIMLMKKLESQIKKERRGELPGISMAVEDDVVTPVKFASFTDNGVDKLHKARWQRRPLGPIEGWWDQISPTRTDVICGMDLARFGAACNVSQFTIRVRHDRRYKGLQVINNTAKTIGFCSVIHN